MCVYIVVYTCVHIHIHVHIYIYIYIYREIDRYIREGRAAALRRLAPAGAAHLRRPGGRGEAEGILNVDKIVRFVSNMVKIIKC